MPCGCSGYFKNHQLELEAKQREQKRKEENKPVIKRL